VAVSQLCGGDERALRLGAHMREEGGGSGVGRGTQRRRRGGGGGLAKQDRGPADDTDPDAPGRAAWGCSTLCVSSAEEERGKEMRLTCRPREFKLNFRNLKSNQSCFDPKRTLPSSNFF
jgi:hypothetical protein